MNNFANEIKGATVNAGELGVFFLGQAGFVFKTSNGKLFCIDPYLSDCCNRYFGFKRLMPYILSPYELKFDYLLISHAHYDHFDPDSVPLLMANGKTRLIGAKDVAAECERLNIKDNLHFLSVGDCFEDDNIKITAVLCDHGKDTPDAIGFMVEAEGKRIYYMGDTAYREDWLNNPFIKDVDMLILPINGAFGNLNEVQAAKVVSSLTPKLAIPCHYWNFAEHGGNPALFCQEMKSYAPDTKYMMMRQGEGVMI